MGNKRVNVCRVKAAKRVKCSRNNLRDVRSTHRTETHGAEPGPAHTTKNTIDRRLKTKKENTLLDCFYLIAQHRLTNPLSKHQRVLYYIYRDFKFRRESLLNLKSQ